MLPTQEKVYCRRKWPAGSRKTSICHRGSWFILWLMGDDTSIHIQMDACWKLKTLIITVKQFMATNCMFTVHRVLSHSSWRDFPVAFEIKGDGEGWGRGLCAQSPTCGGTYTRRAHSLWTGEAHIHGGVSLCHAITVPFRSPSKIQFNSFSQRV